MAETADLATQLQSLMASQKELATQYEATQKQVLDLQGQIVQACLDEVVTEEGA